MYVWIVGKAHILQKELPIQERQFWKLQTQYPLKRRYPAKHYLHVLLLLHSIQLSKVQLFDV